MNCPACSRQLSSLEVASITVDACLDGCAGIWFDLFELQKVEAQLQGPARVLLTLQKQPGVTVNPSRRRKCPRCPDLVMMRRFFSRKKAVEIDECPGCGGIWLDGGEFGKVQQESVPRANADKESRQYIHRLVYQYISQIQVREVT